MKNSKNIIGKNSDKKIIITMFSLNNKTISDSQVVAEKFNHFFVVIGPQLASS